MQDEYYEKYKKYKKKYLRLKKNTPGLVGGNVLLLGHEVLRNLEQESVRHLNYIINAHGGLNTLHWFRLPRNFRVVAYCRTTVMCVPQVDFMFRSWDPFLRNLRSTGRLGIQESALTRFEWHSLDPTLCVWDGAISDVAWSSLNDYHFSALEEAYSGISQVPIQIRSPQGNLLDPNDPKTGEVFLEWHKQRLVWPSHKITSWTRGFEPRKTYSLSALIDQLDTAIPKNVKVTIFIAACSTIPNQRISQQLLSQQNTLARYIEAIDRAKTDILVEPRPAAAPIPAPPTTTEPPTSDS